MHIVRGVLEIPTQLSRIRVNGDDAAGEKIVTGAHIAVVIRPGIAGAPVNEVQLAIIDPGDPGCHAAVFPGIAGAPGLVAGLAGSGDGPKTPGVSAGFGVVGIQKTANAKLTAGN